MQPEIAIAEPEPRVSAHGADGFERVPSLVGATPTALLVGDPGKGIEDAVEVGRDMEAEDLDVVPDVAYDGYVV